MSDKVMVIPGDGDEVELFQAHSVFPRGARGTAKGEVYTRYGQFYADVLFTGERVTAPIPVSVLVIKNARELVARR